MYIRNLFVIKQRRRKNKKRHKIEKDKNVFKTAKKLFKEDKLKKR